MSTNATLNPLTNPGAAGALTDADWVKLHVPRFDAARPSYVAFAEFLEKVLTRAKFRLAPLAFVEVRPKGVPSFAEKILRKRRDFQTADNLLPPDPLVRLTDLCGGRVITQTAEEVQLICRFIETAFDIDVPNSEDVSQRLKPTEFGYRSVHYIVQVNPEKLSAAGIEVQIPPGLAGFPADLLGSQAARRPLKAEIQVRTLLEHAAASLGHDSLYKTEIHVPGRIKRQHATLSAMLEEVDTGFGKMLASLKELESNYGAHFGRKAIDAEIARLRLVSEYVNDQEKEKEKITLAVRIARLALASGQHEEAIHVLTPFRDRKLFGVQRRLGQALTELYWDQPKSREFLEGRSLLEAACQHPPQDSETLAMLADCVAREDDQAARELFHQAIQADASEPVTLSRYLEFEIAHLGNDHAVRISTPLINVAVTRCQRQIESEVNLPAAWSCLTVFYLLLGKPFEALDAIAQLTVLCEGGSAGPSAPGANCGERGHPCAAGRALSRLRDTLRRLHCIRTNVSGFDWCERAVLLMLAVRVADAEAQASLRKLASWAQRPPFLAPTDKIVILAGGCAVELKSYMDGLRSHLLRGCEGLRFTLISGGTTAGISGIAGDLSEASGGKITGIGYLPDHLPRGVSKDTNPKRFKMRFCTAAKDFSPMEPLQGWTDLIAAGVKPDAVKLMAYAVGKIAHTECAVALALKARVGIIENADLPPARQFLDPAWQAHANLIRLPMDAMTLRAFIQMNTTPLSEDDVKRLENAARMAHEDYAKSASPKEPSLAPWDKLDPALKLSNYLQVAYWEKILQEHGLGIRPLTTADPQPPLVDMAQVLGEDGIWKLAELEHGRWNVERLIYGWHYAKTKDISKKLNPCLVPWPDLKNINGTDYQPYDIEAIRGLPKKLREVGLELYRLWSGT